MHVLAYAEVLFRWKLLHKRIELLKAVDPFLRLPFDSYFNSDHSQLGTLRLCVLSMSVAPSRYLHIMWVMFCMPPSRQRHVVSFHIPRHSS